MKKSVTITLFIFWMICTAIITAGLLSYANNKNQSTNQPTAGNVGSPNSSGGKNSPAVTLTPVEVAKHNTTNDCWMIVSGKVYNVTPSINSHSGGAGPIIKYCGQDGTVGFQTKDVGNNHSGSAYSMLANYLIGSLNQIINSQKLQQTVNQQNSSPVPSRRGGEEEDD